MRNIDVKSVIIGALFASTIFFGVGATSPTDKWDDKQSWEVDVFTQREMNAGVRWTGGEAEFIAGWEPIAGTIRGSNGNEVFARKRVPNRRFPHPKKVSPIKK